jgi:hypothetical protein
MSGMPPDGCSVFASGSVTLEPNRQQKTDVRIYTFSGRVPIIFSTPCIAANGTTGTSSSEVEVAAIWSYTVFMFQERLTLQRVSAPAMTRAFHKRRQPMKKRVEFRMLCLFLLVAVLSGCASSRTYSEGILATSDTFMSTEELRSYGLKIDQEIDRVNKGGAVPTGVTREVYLEDLKSRQKDVQVRIAMAEHFKQKDEFEDKYPSP